MGISLFPCYRHTEKQYHAGYRISLLVLICQEMLFAYFFPVE